jgi:hypothetical protein
LKVRYSWLAKIAVAGAGLWDKPVFLQRSHWIWTNSIHLYLHGLWWGLPGLWCSSMIAKDLYRHKVRRLIRQAQAQSNQNICLAIEEHLAV